MIKGYYVRVKLKKHYKEQRPMSFVGKVREFSDVYMVLHGKGIMMVRTHPDGVQIDEEAVDMLIPRENIDNIRVLPEKFDLKNLSITTEGQQLTLVVKGAPDCYLGELGEG